jgi:tripartite-type tricarboxylate transporter receptor subunit TctC
MTMKSIDRRAFVIRSIGALASLGAGHLAAAPAAELKALQIIVPTPPGSQPDLIARWIIEPLSRQAGVAGIVANRPGAAGAIAADAVLAASPESGPLLLGGLDHVAYSHLNSDRRALDPFVDFAPVGAVNRDTWLLATSASNPARSLTALVDASRSKGPLNYASTGEGSTAHLLSARLCKAVGIEAQHVPYKESFLPDLIAGRIDFVVAPTPALLGQIKGARVAALASLTDERLAMLQGVPSIQELGWPDQVFYGGLFLFAPAALAPQAQRLNTCLVESLRQPDITARFRDAAIEPAPVGLEQTRQLLTERLRTVDAMRLAVFGRTR